MERAFRDDKRPNAISGKRSGLVRTGDERLPAVHLPVEVAQRFVPPREYTLRPSSRIGKSRTAARAGESSVEGPAERISTLTNPRAKDDAPRPRGLRSTCNSCARVKKACDGGQPCKRCVRIQMPCVYEKRKRTGPKRPAPSASTLPMRKGSETSEAAALAVGTGARSNTSLKEGPRRSSVPRNPLPINKLLKRP
ncbi:unnamed protein product [Discosporangium mesarthrocarpum]